VPRLPRWLAPSAAALALALAAPAAAAPAGETIVGALAGPPKPSFLAKIRAGELGGVILVGSWQPTEMRRTTARLHAAGCEIGRPLLVLVDQEGGYARRLTWAAPAQTARELGLLGEARTRAAARATAAALRNAGVDVDLAPVADTLVPGGFLRSRSFGTEAGAVGRLAAAFVDGLQSAGVAATAKHFPGLGASRRNTDDHVVRLQRSQLGPFRAAIDAGVKLVMVASAAFPRLDPRGTPAVFSRPIVTGLLRGTLGFDGVVVTDALDAPAPARTPHAAARALAAGVDLLLYTSGSTAHAAYEELSQDIRTTPSLGPHLARAVANIRALKAWLGLTCGSR
jgi:beta-N-acetylhexosaminidase